MSLSHALSSTVRLVRGYANTSRYIEDIRVFLEYETTVKLNLDGIKATAANKHIKLKNVSFKYGSMETDCLKNVSFEIKPNEKIAVVGHNGAGKSTLIKLIMQLYQQERGEILLNGRRAETVTVGSYRAKFGTAFQDTRLFALPICQNVLMDYCADEKDRKSVKDALKKVRFDNKLDPLPNGIDSVLTREFDEDGVILSGGEQQKIALAKTFVNGYEFIIVDEPSAALDPDSEYELNRLMMNSAFDKTVIFISHRLWTTRTADRIYMMDGGEIVEQGTHDELMALNGKYAEMFNIQAENYR